MPVTDRILQQAISACDSMAQGFYEQGKVFMNAIMQALKDDHKYMMEMLYQLERQIMTVSGMTDASLDMDTLLEIVDYLKSYPEICHRPVEEKMFALLQQKLVGGSEFELTAKVMDEHLMLDALAELLDLKIGDYVANKTNVTSMLRTSNMFVRQQLKHMDTEQKHIFPLCERYLISEEWEELGQLVQESLSSTSDVTIYQKLREKLTGSNFATVL